MVDLVILAGTEIGATAAAMPAVERPRKKAIEIGDVVTVLLSGASSIGTGIAANAIYEKLKALRAEPGRLTERSSEAEVEIIDKKLGTRIVVKTKSTEKIRS